MARCARTEFNKLIFVTLALDKIDSASEEAVDKILGVVKNAFLGLSPDDFEPDYRENDGVLEIGRIIQANYLNKDVQIKSSPSQVGVQEFGTAPALALKIGSPGLLDSLYFLEDCTITLPFGPWRNRDQGQVCGS